MQKFATAARTLFWLVLVAVVLWQLPAAPALERSRAAALGRIEAERHSRVIALIDREESASFFGVPVMQSINIDDSEAVRRAIRFTPPEQPIDIVLHTPGGTVLAADEIVMDPNAVLGPVDPQIGDLPAASIVKAVEIKGASHVSDETLIVADIAQKARVQVGVFVAALLEKHDFPITVAAARSLGLKVSTDMPRSVY